jgi:hypothetical protein
MYCWVLAAQVFDASAAVVGVGVRFRTAFCPCLAAAAATPNLKFEIGTQCKGLATLQNRNHLRHKIDKSMHGF